MRKEKEIIDHFYYRFNSEQLKFYTSKKLFALKAIRNTSPFAPYDISIEVSNVILAIVDFKAYSHSLSGYDFSSLEKFAAENDVRFVVVSDGESFQVVDRKFNQDRRTENYNSFLQLIQQRRDIDQAHSRGEIANLIREVLLDSGLDELGPQLIDFARQLNRKITFDEIRQSFYFTDTRGIDSVENKFFRLLLRDGEPLDVVYRYTTLDTIFAMLNYNSFRMNCLVGMNDTTEVNYAENYVYDTKKDFSNAPWQTVDAYNRRFISSCSLKGDDLTQWRLYADDSRGVCLVLKINEEELNADFIIKRISYGEADGTHKTLDLLKTIRERVFGLLGVEFRFRKLGTWRHFFKPYDYAVEQEVRILHILPRGAEKKGWCLTASHNILNPYVEFKLNDPSLPMRLTEVVLGAKCAEKKINLRQFEQLIRDLKRKTTKNKHGLEVPAYDLDKLKISLSGISNYR